MKKAKILLSLLAIITLSDCKKSDQEPGRISSLNCSAFQLSGSVVAGSPVSGVPLTVPYTGGNGGDYEPALANSSGVTGLTALLDSGSFANGNGSVVYTLTGTPSGTGNAIFTLSLGGQSCFASIPVTNSSAAITGINCSGYQLSGALNAGVALSGASFSVPYTDGNGGTYDAQTLNSTGVTGITAALASGSLNNGSGNLTYQLSGTPSGTGTASFNISLGGQSCSIGIPVTQQSGTITSLNCGNAQLSGAVT